MNFRLTRLGGVWLAVGMLVGTVFGAGCSASRDERLPSERLISGCTTDPQCGSNAVCQAGTCVGLASASVIGKVEGAPDGAHLSARPVADELCTMHERQGLICTLEPGGRVVLLAPQIAGYRFTGWTGDRCLSPVSTLDLQKIEQQTVCTAHYAHQLRASGTVDGAPELKVLASSSSPTALCQDNACAVDPNQAVTLEAPVRDGLRLTSFDGVGCSQQSGYRVIATAVDRDVECVARYAPSITARGQAQGTAPGLPVAIVASSPSPGSLCQGPLCAIEAGADVTLLAPEIPGYRFAGWTGEERCLGNDPTLALAGLTRSVVCTADYVPRFVVQVISEGVLAPAGALGARSGSALASCTGPVCTVDRGAEVSLLAGSVPGYRLLSWSGAGCTALSGAAASAPDVSADTTCSAHYVPGVSVTGTVLNASGEVDARSSSPGATCARGSCAIDGGGSVTLTAPSIPGRTLLGWSGDEGCSGSSASITLADVTSSRSCLATYALRYAVSGRAVPEPGGAVVASSTAPNASCLDARCEVDQGFSVSLTASSSPGFRFSGWSGDPGCSGTQASLTLPNVSANLRCNANFVPRIEVVGDVLPAGAGSVLASQSSASAVCAGASCSVDAGTDVLLGATPATGYRFVGWTGCGPDSSGLSLPVSGSLVSQRCTAHFEKLRFVVSALPSAGGEVAGQSAGVACPNASCTVSYGDAATLLALPSVGYEFVAWQGCTGPAQLDFPSVSASQTCSATFARIRVGLMGVSVPAGVGNVLASSSAASAVCSSNGCLLDYGSDATLAADPTAPGYRFGSWSGCSGGVPSGSSISFIGMTASASCAANYIKRWTVFGSPSNPIRGTTTCANGCVVDQGGSVSVTATPTPGYSLTGWSCSNALTDTITLSGISADIRCVASFDPIPQ